MYKNIFIVAQNGAEKGILKRKPARRKSAVSTNIVESVLGKIFPEYIPKQLAGITIPNIT